MRRWFSAEKRSFWVPWVIILTLGLLLSLISAFFADQQFAQYFSSSERLGVWHFHRDITEIGKAEFYIALALLALLYKPFRKKSAYFLSCALTSGLVLHLIKFSVGRQRPHRSPQYDPFVFDAFNTHHHWQSFPSGHSQTLFTVATFIAFLFPRSSPWIFIIGFYLSLTRAITYAHFLSDVIMGALIGFLVSALTLRYLERKYGS